MVESDLAPHRTVDLGSGFPDNEPTRDDSGEPSPHGKSGANPAQPPLL